MTDSVLPVWRIGEPGADRVCLLNARLFDMVFESMVKKCGNPDCGWKISALRSENFSVPEFGDVCTLCHQLYTNLTFMNLYLKNGAYFKSLHDQWMKEKQDEESRRKRRGWDF